MTRRRAPALQVEVLEERSVPAVFAVNSQASLAAAITASDHNGQSNIIRLTRNIDLTGMALPSFTSNGGHAVTLEGQRHELQRTGVAPFRILENDGARLTVHALEIAGGIATSDGGGGIFNHAGRLTLDRVSLVANRAAGTSVGAGLFNFTGATLTIRNSYFADNHSATFGGGMRNIGHVLAITGSTFADNSAATEGGGAVCNFYGGVIDLIENCTLTGNSAVRGGGVCNHGIVSLINCTVVGNSARETGGGIENDNKIPLMVNCLIAGNVHGNLFPNAPVVAHNNVIGGNPHVGPLRNNGGPTPTMALLPGSPALRAGTLVDAPRVDQRGYPRPPGGPIDDGAYQATQAKAQHQTLLLTGRRMG